MNNEVVIPYAHTYQDLEGVTKELPTPTDQREPRQEPNRRQRRASGKARNTEAKIAAKRKQSAKRRAEASNGQ